MTCIVGIAHAGKVYMGADSAGVGGMDIASRKDVKVFQNGEMVIGCTSSFRMIQLLQWTLVVPRRHPEVDLMRYMCTDFIEAVRQCFRNGGFMTVQNNAESGGTFLAGLQGRIFAIHSDFQVAERADGFDACGCGDAYALGSLLATTGEPKERLQKALETAAHFSAGVRAPFVFHEN